MHIYLFYQKWLLNFTFEYSLTDVFHILGVCINFKGFSRDGIINTIASDHIVAILMFKAHVALVFSMCHFAEV